MGIMKLIITLAITMAITLAITATISTDSKAQKKNLSSGTSDAVQNDNTELIPSKRVSRFLAEYRNPRAADHCHKDYEVCGLIDPTHNSTCCNNKCIDLRFDDKNCGACKKKCKYTESCCRGECVNLAYDKRHCGKCNNKCLDGEFCLYALCSYA